jgi:hypothetical protein
MTITEFAALLEGKARFAPPLELEEFVDLLGADLPLDYRSFLVHTNGGVVRGRHRFQGKMPGGEARSVYVRHVFGIRDEPHLSLRSRLHLYLDRAALFPWGLVWIMDDHDGNGICLGLAREHFGRVYFWNRDRPPDPEAWDGEMDTAGNVTLLADSFTDFIAGVGPAEGTDPG